MSVRDSFVARFGEADAAAIEQASRGHMTAPGSIHAADNLGSDPFKYHFLNAIGSECVTRFRQKHGITADPDAMREWALTDGDLGAHDGDIPDYMAILAGAYEEWLPQPHAAAAPPCPDCALGACTVDHGAVAS